MEQFGATQCNTHKGYFVSINSKIPIDLERITKGFEETVNCHGSFGTFHWDEQKGKPMWTIYTMAHIHNTSTVDPSKEPNLYKKVYDMSVANNVNPNFHLNKLCMGLVGRLKG